MTETVNLYAVVTVEATVAEGTNLLGFVPGWQIGDILVETTDHGPEWIFGTDDAVAKVDVGAVRIGSKVMRASDGSINYTRNMARLLSLIQIGARNKQTHEDALKVMAEEIRGQIIEPLTGMQVAVGNFRLNEIVKNFTK